MRKDPFEFEKPEEQVADLISDEIGFFRSYDIKTLENFKDVCRHCHREMSILTDNGKLGDLTVKQLANIWAEVNTGLRKF